MKALKFILVLSCFIALFMAFSFADYGAESDGYCDWGVPIHAKTCDSATYADTAFYLTGGATASKCDSLKKRGSYVPGDSFLVSYGDTFQWLIGDSVLSDLLVTGDLKVDTINSRTTNGVLLLLPDGSGRTQIGDAYSVSIQSLGNDDLYVTGKLEVRGSVYFSDSMFIPQWTAAPATGSPGLFGADSTNDSLIAFIGGTRAVVYPHPSAAVADTATYADTLYGQVGWSGHCVDAYLDSVFGCSPVVFTTPVKIDSSLTADSLNAGKVVVDSLSGGFFYAGDTSGGTIGFIQDDAYLNLYGDTLVWWNWHSMLGWYQKGAQIWGAAGNQSLYLFGSSQMFYYTLDDDSSYFKIDGNYRAFVPARDTVLKGGVYSKLGHPTLRFGESHILRQIQTDPSRADTSLRWMGADTLYHNSENPNKFDNDMFVDGDLTVSGDAFFTTNASVDDSLFIPQWTAAPGTGSSGLFGADTTNDSIIAFVGGTRAVVYPAVTGRVFDSIFFTTGSVDTVKMGNKGGTQLFCETDNNFRFGKSHHIVAGNYNAIMGGFQDTIATGTSWSFMGGGYRNKIGTEGYSAIVGGKGCDIYGSHSFIGGGIYNYINLQSGYSSIVGGSYDSIIYAPGCFMGGGNLNQIGNASLRYSPYSGIVGGISHFIGGDITNTADHSFIGGGERNYIHKSKSSAIVGGYKDSIYSYGDCNFIGGGRYNVIRGDAGDSCNTAMGRSSIVDSCHSSFAMNCNIKKADSTFGVSKQIWVIEGTDTTKITAQGIDFTYENPTIKRGYGIVSTDVVFDTGNVTIITAEDGWVVEDVWFEVTTTFDGDAVVTIGDAGDADGYLRDADISQGVAGYYGYESDERGDYLYDAVNSHSRQKIYAASTAIVIYVTQTTATQGAGTVYVGLKRLK